MMHLNFLFQVFILITSFSQTHASVALSEYKKLFRSQDPLRWSCPLLLKRWSPPVTAEEDPSLLRLKTNPSEIYEELHRRAMVEKQNFKVGVEQASFVKWLESDLSHKMKYLSARKGTSSPSEQVGRYSERFWKEQNYIIELEQLKIELADLKTKGVLYFDLIDFVFNRFNEVNDRLIRDFLTPHLSKQLTFFHSDYGPTRVNVLKRAFPDLIIFFTAEDLNSENFNVVRGDPVRYHGVVPFVFFGDRFPMSNGEQTYHDAGHGWAQWVVDLRAARRYNLPLKDALKLFSDYGARFKKERDVLKAKDFDLWKAAVEVTFETVHRRNFSFDPYFFYHQSGTELWLKEIVWKHSNTWYSTPPLNETQLELLPKALKWVKKTSQKLTEDFALEKLKGLNQNQTNSKFLITPDGGLAQGHSPTVIFKDVDSHVVRLSSTDGSEKLYADLWEISLLDIQKPLEFRFSLNDRLMVSRLLALKSSNHAFSLRGKSGRFKMKSIELEVSGEIFLNFVGYSENVSDLNGGNSKSGLRVPLSDVYVPLSDSSLHIREIDNYDHFKIELLMEKAQKLRASFQFFQRPKVQIIEGAIRSIDLNNDGTRSVTINTSTGSLHTLRVFPLAQVTPLDLWNVSELDFDSTDDKTPQILKDSKNDK